MHNKSFNDITPARVGVGRTGSRPLTTSMLQFRYDHASAIDAVYGQVDPQILKKLNLFTMHTEAALDKETYLLRPDYGRQLSEDSKQFIEQTCDKGAVIQIIVSNGLSAAAINANVVPVYEQLIKQFDALGLRVGTPFYIEQGRVGVMDEIGDILKPDVVIYLIGERPGLATAESMSAYMCYRPTKKTIESDKNVISNIHKGGIPPVEAATQIVNLAQTMLAYEASGIPLVNKQRLQASPI